MDCAERFVLFETVLIELFIVIPLGIVFGPSARQRVTSYNHTTYYGHTSDGFATLWRILRPNSWEKSLAANFSRSGGILLGFLDLAADFLIGMSQYFNWIFAFG